MKAIPLYWLKVFVAGFMWSASISCVSSDQTQTPAKPDIARPSDKKVQTPRNITEKKPGKSGAPPHLGPSLSTPPLAGPNRTAPRQSSSANPLADLEKQMWALVNRDRVDRKNFTETGGRAQPLRWNEKLAAVARAHSRHMLEQQFIAHVDPKGRTPSARITAAGIPWQATGENIALNPSVRDAEAGFMAEARFQQNHRATILYEKFTDVGIGIAQGPDGNLYITQDFVAIPASSRNPGSTLNAANGNR
jgi:uncharacterized protein YkwD